MAHSVTICDVVVFEVVKSYQSCTVSDRRATKSLKRLRHTTKHEINIV